MEARSSWRDLLAPWGATEPRNQTAPLPPYAPGPTLTQALNRHDDARRDGAIQPRLRKQKGQTWEGTATETRRAATAKTLPRTGGLRPLP